jgi:hypothetical protein
MIETHTPEKIHHEISKRLANGVTYIDALVDYARERNIEVETVAEIVKKSTIIKEKVREEAVRMRLVKKDASSPRQLCD